VEEKPIEMRVRQLLTNPAASAVRLSGGAANEVWLVTLAEGRRVVVKATAGLPPDAYVREAEGLEALHAIGGVLTPQVLEQSRDGLVLEALEQPPPDDPAFWERAGHAVARLHLTVGTRFGWPTDGWLGRLPQRNTWSTDGHEFFAEHRLLRYLSEPLVRHVLADDARTNLERICRRLPELVPAAAPVLTHGDLWHGNIVATDDRVPVFIDPAVSWMWAETDLSMMYCTSGTPTRFFDAYQERHALEEGWQARMPLLHLRELLSCAAHFGEHYSRIGDLHEILARYR
jgi:fructosamine-3-kinase